MMNVEIADCVRLARRPPGRRDVAAGMLRKVPLVRHAHPRGVQPQAAAAS